MAVELTTLQADQFGGVENSFNIAFYINTEYYVFIRTEHTLFLSS